MRFIKDHPVLIFFATLFLVVSVAGGYTLTQRQAARAGFGGSQAILVKVSLVSPMEMADQVESIGTALANESVLLTAKVSDTVSRIHFEDGMYVNEGDILVELTNSEETALLAEAQATVEETTRQFNRVKNLIEQKLASETSLDVERAKMETARARLDAIIARLDDRLIRAPFSGLLGFRNVSQGSLLTSSTPVTTLDDISLIKLDFSVPEQFFSSITAGQEITATSTAYPGRIFAGQVRTIGSRIDPLSRSVMIRAHLGNDDQSLRPGMLLNVNLVLNRVNTLVAPEEAIIPIQSKSYVFVVDEAMKVSRREVTVGRRSRGQVEITGGLTDGDQVVTQGIIKLNEGALVRTGSEPGAG